MDRRSIPRRRIASCTLATVVVAAAAAAVSRSAAQPGGDPRVAPASATAFVVPAGRSPLAQPGESIRRPMPARPLIAGARGPLAPPREPVVVDGAAPVVPWDEAGDRVGEVIAAEGRIVSARNIGRLTFLNFHEDWRDKFYVVIFDEAYPSIEGLPEEVFLNQRVRVTGRVDLHRGRPQIKVFDAAQIEVVE